MDQQRIRDALAARRHPGAVTKRLGGLKQLASVFTGGGIPAPFRALADEAFAAPEYSRRDVIERKRGEIGRALHRSSESDWNNAIRTLLPHVAPAATAACAAMATRPFQEGLTRKPFRCPRSSVTVADVRGRWLLRTTLLIGEYDGDIRWVAEHAAFLAGWWGSADLGWLLAGALCGDDATARDVREILVASAIGEHPVAQMGRHVTQALMSSGRDEDCEFVEKLLLSAQRQEGLRQAILESVDEAHPLVFRRVLRLILEEGLARFSSVVRAADSWFGLLWDGSSGVGMESILRRVLFFLEDPGARVSALGESDAETVYLALWSTAFEDVDAAIEPAKTLLRSPSVETRFVATHFLAQVLWSTAAPPLVEVLGDPDLRVAARALDSFGVDQTDTVDGERLFAQLESLMARLPKRGPTLDGIVWPWWKRKLERAAVASALAANASAVHGDRLLPYVPDLDPQQRAAFLRRAAGLAPRWAGSSLAPPRRAMSASERAVALDLLGDTSPDVRAAAFEAMRELPLHDDEIARLIDLLDRKPGDLRTAALTRLLTLDDDALLAAADRLLGDDTEQRRLAGLELLRDVVESDRATKQARTRMAHYADGQRALSEAERAHVGAVVSDRAEVATRDDALGLVDPASLRRWPEPRSRRTELDSPGSRAFLHSLAELVLANQTTEIRTPSGEVKLLVESVHWNFGPRSRDDVVAADPSIPLGATWRAWLSNRPDAQRDADGLEALRALMSGDSSATWRGAPVKQLEGIAQWSAGIRFLRGIVEWCAAWDPPAGGTAFLLDGLEASLATIDAGDFRAIAEHVEKHRSLHVSYFAGKPPAWRKKLETADTWLKRLRWWRELFPAAVDGAEAERVYGLLRWFEERSRGCGMLRVALSDFIGAYAAGVAGEAEFLDLLVGRWSAQPGTSLLREVSSRKTPRALTDRPELLALADRARRRVVEVEVQRGDRVSPASALTVELRWTGGLDTLSRALPALGKGHFARAFGWSLAAPSRQESLSHLVLRSQPRDEDTVEAFACWAREAKVSQARLVELAVYAPHWAAHVNHVLGWPGLESGVWWIQAHTKDDRSWQLQELKEIWAAEVSERTPLSAGDLTEGAVDVAWFTQAWGELGAERWKALDNAAKYAASAGGHTRAQLFARAMGGVVTRAELLARIDGTRHQDSVRALGLLPLADGDDRRRDLFRRYARLESFRREARKFGSARQQSESRAVAIAMENLARTAGYRDPQRLQWAMEREAVADLANGPLVLERGDVRLTLSLDADGAPSLATTKNGKALKAIPAALKKDPEVDELKDRLQALRRQRSRVRDALEGAMCRGDSFAAPELRELLAHPVIAPSLSRLVFVGDGVAGYPAEGGRVLRDHAGTLHALGAAEEVRIAHAVDLLAGGDWSSWQHEAFLAERVQPFKQVFRELYPITDAERGSEQTRRYAGHQVNPRQALALLGGRGWVARPEEGVSRTFHEAGLTAWLGFQEPFHTPADVEGLTLEDVIFTKKGDWKPLALDGVPPRLFSEAMRDLDLVVSVAHRGGVDPEATASTVEMRGALVRETCALLGLDNVELQPTHAIVRGLLGRYSVHLGSAGAMLLPGTFLPIVAVHSQHRGRMFLPFADDDPRTAEVLSKVLMLARDREIRDPNILQWIRAGSGVNAESLHPGD